MKTLLIFNLAFTVLGISYNLSSFDFTLPVVENLHSLLLLISSLTLGALVVQNYEFKTAGRKALLIIGLILNFILTSITTLQKNKGHVDVALLGTTTDGTQHIIIRQYLDTGICGEHYRTVQVSDIIPGLRYIHQVSE
ncbi:MAG: hypothetical protein IPN13_12110 [Bacteroidetes bacterium]|nr:hypothetical protein [Bacteroidota bacterium]